MYAPKISDASQNLVPINLKGAQKEHMASLLQFRYNAKMSPKQGRSEREGGHMEGCHVRVPQEETTQLREERPQTIGKDNLR